MKNSILQAVAAALALWLLPAFVNADGIIIPYPYPPRPWPEPRPPAQTYSLDIKYHHVETLIENEVATTRVDEQFENPYNFDVEGTYIFPLPKSAAYERFSLKVDGKAVEGEMLDADEAAREYRRLVNLNRDPALLEYVGRGAIKARIFPIPAKTKKRVEISYTELLSSDGGLVKFVYPLDTERFSRQPLDDVAVKVDIKTTRALETVFSPSHKIQLERKSPNAAEVSYHAKNVKPAADFVLYYSVGAAEVGARLLADKETGEDGYFLLVITPPPAPTETPAPKEVIFVVDISGSMAGDKIQQVKDALRYCLEQLRPGDRFNVIPFNETPMPFTEVTVPASAANVAAAVTFVDKLAPGGGTNIDGALAAGLASQSPEAEGPTMVVFLTDGKPTVGERNVADIVAHARAANETLDARIFCFGVGYNVKAELLDDLARKNGGTAQYVEPAEDVEVAVTSFYRKISRPVLSDVELSWEGVELYELYPAQMPDLFAGTQLTVLGRFRGELADGALALTGERGGQPEEFRYALSAVAAQKRDNKYIPPLWAMRKIGFLLEQIKLEGEDRGLIDAVVALSKRYGIPTPYTSYLVEETAPAIGAPPPTIWHGLGGAGAADLGSAGKWMANGATAEAPATAFRAPRTTDELSVRESKAIGRLKAAAVARAPYAGRVLRYVVGKSFHFADGVWYDIALDEERSGPEIDVKFASEEYFALLEERPALAPFFALGEEVKVLFEGAAYSVRR